MTTTQQHKYKEMLRAFDTAVSAGSVSNDDKKGFFAGWPAGYAEKVKWVCIANVINTAAQGQDDKRTAFEHWFSEGGAWPKAMVRNGESYMLMQASAAWIAWQAAWEAYPRQSAPRAPSAALQSDNWAVNLRRLIADDARACEFQSLVQYRNWLLKVSEPTSISSVSQLRDAPADRSET